MSSTSLALAEPFSEDVKPGAAFAVARKLVAAAAALDPAAAAAAAAAKRRSAVAAATGLDDSLLQVKKEVGRGPAGSYVTQALGSTAGVSREELLLQRSKARGRDKFC